jgi:dGTPase
MREKEVFMLKQLTWHYVILNPLLATQQHGLRRLIRELFEILHRAADKKNYLVFPFCGSRAVRGIIADYLAGMTEQQARKMYLRLCGISASSALT